MKIFTIIWIIWIVSEILLSKFMRAKKTNNNLDKSSLRIIWITIIISISIGMFVRKSNLILTYEYYQLIYDVGIFLIIAGLVVRWVSILKLKKSFTVNVAIAKDQDLVQSGLYKSIRHPAYLGSLLSFLGFGIVFNNWLTLIIIFIPILAAFLYRITIEENVLSESFGKRYLEYKKISWKLIPYIF